MDQIQQLKTFKALKKVVESYEKKLRVLSDFEGRYEVEFDRKFEVKSKKTKRIIKKEGLYFVGIIIQSSYVGFYFMPIYSDKSKFRLSAELQKKLRGKSCFHFKEVDGRMLEELKEMVDLGFRIYESKMTGGIGNLRF